MEEGLRASQVALRTEFKAEFCFQKDLIVPNDVYRVMAIDALASSHPLSSPADEINTPAQISEVFDSISYSKVRRGLVKSCLTFRAGGIS